MATRQVSETRHRKEDSPKDVLAENGLATRLDLTLQEPTQEELAKRLDLALQELTQLVQRFDLTLQEIEKKKLAARLEFTLGELTRAAKTGERVEAQIAGLLNELAALRDENRRLKQRLKDREAPKWWRPWQRSASE